MPGPVFLRGDLVDLHVIDEADLPFLQRLVNDPSVWASLRRSSPATARDEQQFYEEALHAPNQEHLLICTDGEAVGIVGLQHIDTAWGVAEIGYFVDPASHGQGYATAAVGLLSDYSFEFRRLEKLIAWVLPDNEPSRRVLEKNGFQQEAHLEEYAYRDGERKDMCIYGRMATD